MEYIPVIMLRPTLDDVPQHALPAGFSLRYYRPGDDAVWIAIWQAAEAATGLSTITRETFDSNFGLDLRAMEDRCLFIVGPDGRDVGTTTAWYEPGYLGKEWGRIHWVAILPEFQGKKLAKPMLSAAMNRMKELGHQRAILGTQTPRLAAIKTYLDFGFVPDMTAENARRAWELVRAALPHPALGL